jgi:glycosyltransferase involved in cell wall biosynthesis
LDYDYEIIFVNDGSLDNTWEEIKKITKIDKKIKAIDLSRNF